MAINCYLYVFSLSLSVIYENLVDVWMHVYMRAGYLSVFNCVNVVVFFCMSSSQYLNGLSFMCLATLRFFFHNHEYTRIYVSLSVFVDDNADM